MPLLGKKRHLGKSLVHFKESISLFGSQGWIMSLKFLHRKIQWEIYMARRNVANYSQDHINSVAHDCHLTSYYCDQNVQ